MQNELALPSRRRTGDGARDYARMKRRSVPPAPTFLRARLLLCAWGIAAGTLAAEIPLATIVRFNTACAHCHEGECSGRLSFAPDLAADDHILRYVAAADADERRDLRRLLAYMKRHCAHYPMGAPAGGREGVPLAQWRSPAGDAYFIPLGELAAGRWRARLGFAAPVRLDAQVVSARFEIEDRPGLWAAAGDLEFEFAVDAPQPHYLRLLADRPAVLERLTLEPLGAHGGR